MNKKRLELLLQHLKLVGQTDAWDLMEVISALLEEEKLTATEWQKQLSEKDFVCPKCKAKFKLL